MIDFINKLIKFPKVNIIVKPTLCLYKTENSQILLCEETKSKNKFCIKIILTQINDNYRMSSINTEILLLEKLKQEENIVQLIDFITISQYNYLFFLLLMEYCQYHTLFDLIKQNFNNKQILNDSLIYSYIYQIAKGIKSIHKNKYCHMDLRPENILFKDKEKLVICDFGSATNQFYMNNNINKNNNIVSNNLLFDITYKTRLFYRVPEEFNIHSEYPLSEKVDIYCLGIILFMLLLSYIPSFNDIYSQFYVNTSKKIRFQIFNEIKTLCNPCFSELIENILQINPNKRYNIDEVITFLIANENKILPGEAKYINEKFYFSEYYNKMLYEFEKQEMNKNIFNISVLCRKLLETNSIKKDIINDIPNNSYLDMIINKVNQEPRKAIKFYRTLFNSNIYFYNIYSIKMAYIFHYFIYNFNNKNYSVNCNAFINNIDIISPNNFDIGVLLVNLINFYNFKINNNYVDKNETIKNIQVCKFILLYCRFIRNKIILLKKRSLLISNDNTINVINTSSIISPNFVFDIFNLFTSVYQLLFSIPFNINILTQIFDTIANLLNKEIVTLNSILLTQIIALMKMNKKPTFLEQFIDITMKIAYFFQKLQSFRKQFNSKYEIIYFLNSNNPDKKLKDLLNYIKSIKFDERFNVNEFFNPNSNIRKQMSYIPIKIVCCAYEEYKNDFPELNNNSDNNFQNNNKNNLNNNYNNKQDLNNIERLKNENNKNIDNKNNNNNNNIVLKLNNELENLNINNNLNNKNIINNKNNLKNSKNSNVSNKNNNINNISSNGNKNSNKNSSKNSNNNSNNKNSHNNSNNKNSNNNSNISSFSNNEDYNDFNKCFFNNNKENNEEENFSYKNEPNIVSEISSSLNLSSYINTNIRNTNKLSEIKINNQNEGNTLSNLQQIINPSTRVSSNFPGDTNAISNTIINNINNKNINYPQNNNNESMKNKNKINNNINNNVNNDKNIINKINNIINKSKDSNNKQYVVEEILSFLKFEFSKPIFQFIIQQNSIKTLNLIGYGGTSTVYLGNYRGTDVAIKKIKVKEINDNYFKEFKNEIVTLTMIRHPNLIIFMGTMIENNNLCIVTEYCKGGTLFDLLYKKKHIDISWNLRLRILIDISKAMNFLHTNNPQIIHNDLKSLNILLTDDIRENSENNNVTIKINDFGLSKIIDKDKIEWESPQEIVGSVQWMAPEVIQNNFTNNAKVDVYSFGIIIWEVCTRIQPYKDMSILQIINFVCSEEGRPDCNLLPLEQMPKGLLELMKNCWNTDPNLRPDFSSVLFTLTNMQSLDL